MPRRLYRSVLGAPYAGPGSFWSPDPAAARRYGKREKGQRLIWTNAHGAALEVSSDDELADALATAGVPEAEARVMDADWLSQDVYEVLRRLGYSWVVRPIDPEVSMKTVEWIYVGARPVAWNYD